MRRRGLDLATARTYSDWFRCLSDPNRILILNYLARSPGPRTVRDITETVGLAQSTVSHHLRTLADTGFVTLEAVGNATHVVLDPCCMDCLPDAASAIMGTTAQRVAVPTAKSNGARTTPPAARRARARA